MIRVPDPLEYPNVSDYQDDSTRAPSGGFNPPPPGGFGPPPGYAPPPGAWPPPPSAAPASAGRGGGFGMLLGVGCLGLVGIFVVMSVFGALLGNLKGVDADAESWSKEGPKVGLVTLEGAIVDATAHKVIKGLESLAAEKDVLAIVLRIESPGGSIAPSQEIYRAVQELGKIKPIIASMGSVAASGGYYVALPARKIYALDGTVTGSIGVIASSMLLKDLFEQTLKIRNKTYKTGALKDALSPFREPTKEDEAFVNDLIAQFYVQYAEDVIAARGIDPRTIPEIAQAQVVTGRKAKALKMIDEIGGLREAARAALAAADPAAKGEDLILVKPKRKPGDFLEELFGGEADSRADDPTEKAAAAAVDRAAERLGVPRSAAAPTAPFEWRMPW